MLIFIVAFPSTSIHLLGTKPQIATIMFYENGFLSYRSRGIQFQNQHVMSSVQGEFLLFLVPFL